MITCRKLMEVWSKMETKQNLGSEKDFKNFFAFPKEVCQIPEAGESNLKDSFLWFSELGQKLSEYASLKALKNKS